MASLSEFLSDLDNSDELMSENEAESMHGLVNWRQINKEQWESGTHATLGEDGEALAIWGEEIRAEHVLEDEYEELLLD